MLDDVIALLGRVDIDSMSALIEYRGVMIAQIVETYPLISGMIETASRHPMLDKYLDQITQVAAATNILRIKYQQNVTPTAVAVFWENLYR